MSTKVIVAALRSRCGHYIFALWFLLQSSFFFTARCSYASAVLGVVILSVCPLSVCHTHAL